MQLCKDNVIKFNVELACKLGVEVSSLYSIIVDMSNGCNIVFIDLKQVVKRFPILEYATARRNLQKLSDGGYIKVLEGKEKVERLSYFKRDNPYGHEICEWCNSQVITLESHHYPIPKSEGGKKTVDICPDCHSAFHHSFLVYIM